MKNDLKLTKILTQIHTQSRVYFSTSNYANNKIEQNREHVTEKNSNSPSK